MGAQKHREVQTLRRNDVRGEIEVHSGSNFRVPPFHRLGSTRPSSRLAGSWYTDADMLRTRFVALLTVLFLSTALFLSTPAMASAYRGTPKLVVILVIDQFRGDYLERYHDEYTTNGFRAFMERGAWFPACYYHYAVTHTAPGHATLATGSYIVGHGILDNEWWDPERKREVTSVEDDSTKLVGAEVEAPGASPHNLLADTLGDELRLATQGRSRVYGIALKDRAAILPAGFSANGAFWIEPKSGLWVTSTYYMSQAPQWLVDFNSGKRAQKYLNLDWKNNSGEVMGSTRPRNDAKGRPASYFELVGSTPFGNEYTFEFARELVEQEKLGRGPTTDLLTISLSANDLLGHAVGPDAPQMHAMALALDRQIGDFLGYLGRQLGLATVWVALSADHGVAPTNATSASLHLPAATMSDSELRNRLDSALASRMGRPGEYIAAASLPLVFLNEQAFTATGMKEADAERETAEAMRSAGFVHVFGKQQLVEGRVPPTLLGQTYANSVSPYGGWWVMGMPMPFTLPGKNGTTHGTPYAYDQHVPLAFFGLSFRQGVFREEVEPIDLAPTLAAMLGINKPSSATGKVLTEAIGVIATRPETGNAGPNLPMRSRPATEPQPRPAQEEHP